MEIRKEKSPSFLSNEQSSMGESTSETENSLFPASPSPLVPSETEAETSLVTLDSTKITNDDATLAFAFQPPEFSHNQRRYF
jgi:hypothetical protein